MTTDTQKEIYREEAGELLADIENALLELEERPDDAEQIARAFRALHTIKGSGAMAGFDDIAAFSHELESLFDRVRAKDIVITSELISFTLAGCDQIRAMLNEAFGGEPANPYRARDILRYLKALFPTESVKESGKESVKCDVLSVMKEDNLNTFHLTPNTSSLTYRIHFHPHADILRNGTNPIYLISELREMGECKVVARIDAIPMLDGYEPESCYTVWDIILTTDKQVGEIRNVFIFVEDSAQITIEPIKTSGYPDEEGRYKRLGEILVERGHISSDALEEVLKKQKRIGDMLIEEKIVKPGVVESALAEQQHVREISKIWREAEKVSGIRVDSEKLDKLANLVGELVTLQARFLQTVVSYENDELMAVAEEMDRLTSELRDNTMTMRMVPIGKIFIKFRRLVRDLSAELKKQVRLSIDGEDTELDKTIIEQLHDPIVHIIRNCIDHGIETAEIRRAAEKPEHGQVYLSASYSGAGVKIEISDDGAGLSEEMIRAKAIEKGLIAPNANIAEKDLFSLIFLPGFSTAATVTNVSGRGVGMDVVRRRMEELRGSVDIHSKKGEGTVISLTLPLTLAMIDGLLVKAGDEFYVFPLPMVEECMELTLADINASRIANVRGELVPYIFLREILEISGDAPMTCEVIITRADNYRVGFVADQIVGQHQTVIRGLGKYCAKAREFSGATVLADGTVALIADVPRLIEAAKADEERKRTQSHQLKEMKG
ncbi:MAG: chemotaxis protein CheA [Desulfobacteraceae bacterium IS3]|nr:MAG: chemotaxis protein CheA [Desulfobacteraceae bacterium IS3]